MTADEFNEKYKDYLEPGFGGMEIEDPLIISICAMYFRDWVKIPEFRYSQIKIKFLTSRVYVEPARIGSDMLEGVIDLILINRRENE